eukprot:scaffold13496_cov28-Attheya_sp.AAC.1
MSHSGWHDQQLARHSVPAILCTKSTSAYAIPNRAARQTVGSLWKVGVTPTAGVLLGSGERAEGYVRRGIFHLKKLVVYLLV